MRPVLEGSEHPETCSRPAFERLHIFTTEAAPLESTSTSGTHVCTDGLSAEARSCALVGGGGGRLPYTCHCGCLHTHCSLHMHSPLHTHIALHTHSSLHMLISLHMHSSSHMHNSLHTHLTAHT